MNITIQAVHFDADIKLKELIKQKLSNLVRFYNEILNVDVFLKLENSGQVRDKIVELKAGLPGNTIVVTATGKTFESSLDEAHDIIVRQLKKHKERVRA